MQFCCTFDLTFCFYRIPKWLNNAVAMVKGRWFQELIGKSEAISHGIGESSEKILPLSAEYRKFGSPENPVIYSKKLLISFWTYENASSRRNER